ncbi:GNAT family N-acetyltransferase [Streptomyces rubellomurinus]|uniref:GNAT family N-acetyltransferase n=1 Tax=Streptomyces rubellomurinus (strain ATCC 31215) TaxID=359131 RepID=UPI00099DD4CB|nr:GNAT family N-acetyltransferase [Streptomyces rubellomurinus]
MTGVEAAADYRVEVVRGVDALPEGLWERLAPPGDPMWSRDVLRAMEVSAIGPDGYAYLVLRQDAPEETGALAVLPVSLFSRLRLDEVLGADVRRRLAPLRRLLPGLLRVPMLFCGHLLGQGHLLTGRQLPAPALDALIGGALALARREGLGTVVFKDFAPVELAALRPSLAGAGFFFLPALPDTELRLGPGGFEDYLTRLPAKARRNARSKLRRAAAWPGLRTEVLEDFAHLLPEMLGLYRQVMDRAEQRLDVLDADFLAAVHSGQPAGRRLVACFEGERLVAFLLCLFAGTGATGARIGLDYRIAHEAGLYHAVHHAAIRLAIDSGCTHIRFAQTAYQPKVELGCDLVEQWYAMTHLRPLRRALLRRLLPPALVAARAKALGPHAAEHLPLSLPEPKRSSRAAR